MYSLILHVYDTKIPYAGKLNEKNISFKIKKMSPTYSYVTYYANLHKFLEVTEL